MKSQYLSVKEVASILGISPKTVNVMVNKDQIPGHFRLGKMHFIDQDIFFEGLKKLASTKTKKIANVVNRHQL